MKKEKNVGRNQSIDLIKIIAMFMVVMMHLGLARIESHLTKVGLPISAFAGVAMPLFFMVSGYLMYSKNITWRYCCNKIWKIIRFCLYVCIPLSVVFTLTSGELNILFPECLLFKGRLYQFWYLGSMIIIYSLLPIILHYSKRERLEYILLGGGVIICSIIFIFNISVGFEKAVNQPFRLWNWLLYFLLGMFVHKKEKVLTPIKWYYIIPSLLIYILFFDIVKIGANEYYFCSPICIIHSFICFVAILNLHISNNIFISLLSKCFLPVYTFHIFIAVFLCNKTPAFYFLEQYLNVSIAYTIEYILVAITCIVFSLILLKIPYMDRVFKI